MNIRNKLLALALGLSLALSAPQPVQANSLQDIVTKGSTDRSVNVDIIDSTDGTPETGVVFNTSGIDLWYRREGAVRTAITEATLAALTTAHADGGFLHVSDGTYRLDLPDAAFATGANYVDFGGTVTGMIVIGGRVRLVDYSLEDSVRMGLTALPNAAAQASGGLYTRGTGAGQINQDANGRIDVNIEAIDTDTTSSDNLELYTDGTTPQPVNAIQLSADATAADNAELFFDGTGYAGTNNVIPTVTTVTNAVSANVTQVSGDSGAADRLEAMLDNTCGSYPEWGIARGTGCTAQSATATTLVMDSSAAFADDTAIGMTLVACGSTQGYCQARVVTDSVLSTDTLTVPTWTVTPSGTVTFTLIATAPASSSGSGATAQEVWEYATRGLTILDEDSTTIDLNASFVGGVTTFDEDTTTIDINATTLGTVTTATTATNLTNLPTIPANWLTAAGTAADFTTEVTASVATQASVNTIDDFLDTEMAAVLAAVDTEVASILADTNELQVDWVNGGRLDLLLDLTLADTNELQTDWVNGGRLDLLIDGIKAKTDPMTYTSTNFLQVDAQYMNAVEIVGAGTEASPWNGE